MGLSQGMQIGSCEILDPLGVGGMGEVWRGRDTKLGRDVAVKALPDSVAHDMDRLARFEREAQALAALNHPNLAIIHELAQEGGTKYLILELVEGETLAERISRGPIPINDALDIAVQLSRAIGAAHEKGIVHRDLKPANIKITPEGRVKVLDFGLAKVYESRDSDQDLSNSPTLGAEFSQEGMIVGTAAYMSPEQARGKDVDRRSDVWAFGCVFYEMLTGRQPFPNGETISDTLAGILVYEPDLEALPAATPAKIRALIERCLRKDERRRVRDIGDVRIGLEESIGEFAANAAVATRPVASRRHEIIFGALATMFLLASVGIAVLLMLHATPAATAVRLDTPVPVGVVNGFYLSPDGRKVAFVSRPLAGARIWVRSLDSAAAEPIPSTEGISAPDVVTTNNTGWNNSLFWSADSQSIGFIAEGKLKKVAATGGPAQVLATLPTDSNFFGTWNSDGVILLAADGSANGPLLRVSAGGGQPAHETELDKAGKETSHRYPYFLPDGKHYLYLATGGDARDRAVYVGQLGSRDRHPLPGIAAEAKYSNGHIVFIRDGALMAQPFNLKTLQLSGDAFTLADKFAPPASLTWPFSVSVNGALSFRASEGSGGTNLNAELVWYDRKGTRVGVAGVEGDYPTPELSHDGKFVAFARATPADIWWLDIEKNRQTKLTTDMASDMNPRWSPDGSTIAFDSTREGASGIYLRAVGVSGTDKLLFKSEGSKALTLSDWSYDGKYMAYVQDGDVWALALNSDGKTPPKPIQITKSPFNETLPRISPDDKWIAYVSNKTGQSEVYVQSFPEPGVEQQVSTGVSGNSTNAQAHPHWSRDGKELFYFTTGTRSFMVVSIKPSGSSLNAAAPVPAIGHPALRAPFSSYFSVTADGRFLLQLAPNSSTAATTATSTASTAGVTTGPDRIAVIVNWAAKPSATGK